MNELIYCFMFRVLRCILAWITPLWRAVMWLRWARKGSLPCIRCLTGQGPAEGGENSHNIIWEWYNWNNLTEYFIVFLTQNRIETVQISKRFYYTMPTKITSKFSCHLILIHRNDSIMVNWLKILLLYFWGCGGRFWCFILFIFCTTMNLQGVVICWWSRRIPQKKKQGRLNNTQTVFYDWYNDKFLFLEKQVLSISSSQC